MSQTRAGIFIHPTGNGPIEQVYEETLELIRVAEEEGIHSAWVSQLHFQPFRGRLSSPFPFLVRAAERTQHIQLSTGVVTLPFENPLRLAEDASVTNVLLKNRLAFGVGSGEPIEAEFAPFGEIFAERHQRSIEALPPLLRALRGEPLPPGDLVLQPPAKNLAERVWWASGSRERSLFAAQQGVNLLLNVDHTRWDLPITQTNAEAAAIYRQAWTHNRPSQVGIWRIVFLSDAGSEDAILDAYWKITELEARENFKRGLINRAQSPESLRDHYKKSKLLVKGNTDSVLSQLREEEEEIGFDDFLFYFTYAGLPFQERIHLLRHLARDISGPLGWLKQSGSPAQTPRRERELQPA